jgi:predicted PolB exonuclease-like 3'-5' exonuclease
LLSLSFPESENPRNRLQNVRNVGYKGFNSEKNAKAFYAGKLKYILPLKRNSTLIDYDILKRVHLLKIMGKTQFAEIPKKSRKLIEKLGYLLPE